MFSFRSSSSFFLSSSSCRGVSSSFSNFSNCLFSSSNFFKTELSSFCLSYKQYTQSYITHSIMYAYAQSQRWPMAIFNAFLLKQLTKNTKQARTHSNNTYIHTYIHVQNIYGHTGMKKNDQLGKKVFFFTLRTIQVTYCAFPIMDKYIMDG